MIFQAIRAMSIAMPETPDEMMQLPGVTKANFEKFGKRLLDVTVKHSAEKYGLLLTEQDTIEEFNTQATPGPSRAPAKKAPAKKKSDATDPEWINVDSQESSYFSRPAGAAAKRGKATAAAKRKSFNFGAKPKARRNSTAAKVKAKYSPKKPGGSKKTGSHSQSSSGNYKSSSSGFIGFMPMPLPK